VVQSVPLHAVVFRTGCALGIVDAVEKTLIDAYLLESTQTFTDSPHWLRVVTPMSNPVPTNRTCLIIFDKLGGRPRGGYLTHRLAR